MRYVSPRVKCFKPLVRLRAFIIILVSSNIMLAHTSSSFLQQRARASTSDITQLAASVKRPSTMIKAVDFGQ